RLRPSLPTQTWCLARHSVGVAALAWNEDSVNTPSTVTPTRSNFFNARTSLHNQVQDGWSSAARPFDPFLTIPAVPASPPSRPAAPGHTYMAGWPNPGKSEAV